MSIVYLLDANVFIEAKNFYYRFEIAPRFWEWLDEQQADGQLASVDPIGRELRRGNDELAEWVKERMGPAWFLPVDDEETQKAFVEIVNWVPSQSFKQPAIDKFLDCGDPWLIAKARVLNATVVTLEVYEPNTKKKVKIPNVCRAFDIPFVDTFDMLSRMGARI